MCGITGFLNPRGVDEATASVLLQNMTNRLAHRGPDDSGTWLDGQAGVGFGHRRLSILDLSTTGHQPMVSSSSRFVLTFNGEIYNHRELRVDLERWNPSWQGTSDTETLLHMIEICGLEATLKKVVGMFAFAVWDRKERILTLARDRLGEKPMYYGWQGNTFLFGSELKALVIHPCFQKRVDRIALARYFENGYLTPPYTIYDGINQLLPGTFLQVTSRLEGSKNMVPVKYWALGQGNSQKETSTLQCDAQCAVDGLEAKLKDSISLQQSADVPVGAFLSGGIDSSTIVALMQEVSEFPVKTFTIGFEEQDYNEAVYAKKIAQHLGTDHTELYVTPKDAMDVIPKLTSIYDEPFGDASAIPTFIVSELASKDVAVSLSGDGGDELFGGYSRYQRIEQLWMYFQFVPAAIKRPLAHMFNFNAASEALLGIRFFDKSQRIGELLSTQTIEEFQNAYSKQWRNTDDLVLNLLSQRENKNFERYTSKKSNLTECMMYMDMHSYLPGDILQKVDRAAMANSLETRVPMLDHRVVEYAWNLPSTIKLRGGSNKWMLKQILSKYVPVEMFDRPKMGFGVPVDSWLKGPLREWAEDLLSEKRLVADGFLNPKVVRQKWKQHIAGQENWRDPLWIVLCFQSWLMSDH